MSKFESHYKRISADRTRTAEQRLKSASKRRKMDKWTLALLVLKCSTQEVK